MLKICSGGHVKESCLWVIWWDGWTKQSWNGWCIGKPCRGIEKSKSSNKNKFLDLNLTFVIGMSVVGAIFKWN